MSNTTQAEPSLPTATTPTIRTLIEGLVDYAGLFPPAKLDMDQAVAEYARHLAAPEAWILGRFVVPVARLDAFETEAGDLLPKQEGEKPWGLSVLVGADPATDREKVRVFDAIHAAPERGLARVEAVEIRLENGAQAALVAELFAGLEIYFEIDSNADPEPLMRAIAPLAGARAKIRTGGITQDAIPDALCVARFLAAAARTGVTLKATAGLHHPLRGDYRLTYEDDSPTGRMHGFLNLFLAASLLVEGNISEEEARDLLEERQAEAFDFARDSVTWRGHRLSVQSLAKARASFATSYGSCSFKEPVDDLRSLGLLA